MNIQRFTRVVSRAHAVMGAFSYGSIPHGSGTCSVTTSNGVPSVPPPQLFDYKTIVENLKPNIKIIDAIESAFGQLAIKKVDVPIPMHIGIPESEVLNLKYNFSCFVQIFNCQKQFTILNLACRPW